MIKDRATRAAKNALEAAVKQYPNQENLQAAVTCITVMQNAAILDRLEQIGRLLEELAENDL